MRRAICLGILIAVTVLAPVILCADAKGDWAKSFERRAAVLKIDLPTLDPDRIGLLVLSSVRGTYYTFERLFDRTPEQLVTKIQSDRAAGKSVRVVGWETGQPEPAHLTMLKSGAAVTVHHVELRERLLVVWLWDEFAQQKRTMSPFNGRTADPPSTCFMIEWPEKWSNDFHERTAVETAMTQALTW